MYCAEDNLDKIREKINIKDYIAKKIALTKKGNVYIGYCPFHQSSIPAFIIDEEHQAYGCHECGCSGDIFDFVMNFYHKSFSDAVCMLSMTSGVSINKGVIDKHYYKKQRQIIEINQIAERFYHDSLSKSTEASEYLKTRKLEKETIDKFCLGYVNPVIHIYNELQKLGFCDEDIMSSGIVAEKDRNNKQLKPKERYDKFYNRVIFPIKNENNVVVGFGGRVMGDKKPKYINSQETSVYDKSVNLFGLNLAKNSSYDYFLLCEGFMDVISMHQTNFDNAIASLGTSLTMNQIIKLSKYKKKIILTYDSDEPGLAAAKRAIPMLGSCNIDVKVINLDPYKDPDEFIRNLGKDEFLNRIKSAEPADPWLVKTILKSKVLTYEEKIKNIADIFEKQYFEKEKK